MATTPMKELRHYSLPHGVFFVSRIVSNCPSLLCPHAMTIRPASARCVSFRCYSSNATQSAYRTGVFLFVFVPSPTVRTSYYPMSTVPSDFRTMACSSRRFSSAPLSPLTCTGYFCLQLFCLPIDHNCCTPCPHCPSDFSRLTILAMAITPVSPITCTGAFLFVYVPSPTVHNCYCTCPHRSARFQSRLCSFPASMAITPLS